MRVLIVEDERKTASFIRKALQEEGFAVDMTHSGSDVLLMVSTTSFDVVLMDIMLPGCDGLSVLRQIRQRQNPVPVLLISARGSVEERIQGLNTGADDYLSKPFELGELVARVRSLGRRTTFGAKPVVMRLGDLQVDTVSREVRRGERKIDLSAREYRLLEFLLRTQGRVSGRMQIMEKVWDYNFDPGTNLVDVYIGRLREKIDKECEPKLLHTVRGVGYVMKVRS